jgi:hypothetical protein
VSDYELSGAELARLFSAEVVEPLLARALPRLRYATGRLGSGSDVLGLDDAMSRNHDWGCRLTLLVEEPDRQALPQISDVLEHELPERYRQFPVRFPLTWDVSVSHKVDLATVGDFATGRLGVDPTEGLSVLDWLVLTGQSVLEVTAGPVFTDRTATLAPLRQTLCWYPPDVERYALAAGWNRLAQHMPMLGRTAERGDELGSRLLSAQLAQDLLWLAFTLSRQWQPYAKWRGALLRALPVADEITGLLETASTAPDWRQRETALADATEKLLDLQRARGLPAPASAVTRFWNRPYRTIEQTVLDALLSGITDPQVARLPPGIGTIEQWIDSVDVLSSPQRRSALQAAYRTCLTAR